MSIRLGVQVDAQSVQKTVVDRLEQRYESLHCQQGT
jgi:hypothetical protein